jgi:hypothetical protein
MTAVRLGCSYEYVRKMIRGESLPSPSLLNKLCSIFHWKTKKIERLVHLDKCRRQYGPIFWTVLGKNPRYEPLYILWPDLTPGEKQRVIHLLRTWRTRQEGRATAEQPRVEGQHVAEL